MNDIKLYEIDVLINDSIKEEVKVIKEKIIKDINNLRLNSDEVVIEWENEDKFKVEESQEGVKIWRNRSGNQQTLLSKEIINNGTHVLRLKSINDPGG